MNGAWDVFLPDAQCNRQRTFYDHASRLQKTSGKFTRTPEIRYFDIEIYRLDEFRYTAAYRVLVSNSPQKRIHLVFHFLVACAENPHQQELS